MNIRSSNYFLMLKVLFFYELKLVTITFLMTDHYPPDDHYPPGDHYPHDDHYPHEDHYFSEDPYPPYDMPLPTSICSEEGLEQHEH